MIRQFVFFCLAANVGLCGPFGFGLKAGAPATGLAMSSYHDRGTFASKGGWFVIGPSVELRLPWHLGIEADAFYRSVRNPSGSSWEFPVLGKYRASESRRVSPFAVSGISFHRNELRYPQVGPTETIKGFVLGAGVEAKASIVRLVPEVRYTHWRGDYRSRGEELVHRNQLQFLFGITF